MYEPDGKLMGGEEGSGDHAHTSLYIYFLSFFSFSPPLFFSSKIDQFLPLFRNSENRDLLGKKIRGLGVWSILEIGEFVRWTRNSGIKPILQSKVMECNRKGIICTFSAPP